MINGTWPEHSPYLLQVPCSWGAVYFPEHWNEFHSYVKMRMDPEKKTSVVLPNKLKPNFWRESWKKFYIELMYMKGLVLLYPNYSNTSSFSTNHMEPGVHIKADYLKREKILHLYKVPLLSNEEAPRLLDELPDSRLPDLASLPLFGIYHDISTLENIKKVGERVRRTRV